MSVRKSIVYVALLTLYEAIVFCIAILVIGGFQANSFFNQFVELPFILGIWAAMMFYRLLYLQWPATMIGIVALRHKVGNSALLLGAFNAFVLLLWIFVVAELSEAVALFLYQPRPLFVIVLTASAFVTPLVYSFIERCRHPHELNC